MEYTGTKIRKDKARKLYNEGKEIVIVGDNVNRYHFFSGLYLARRIQKDSEKISNRLFDDVINSFEFYLERELGRRAAYYIDKKENNQMTISPAYGRDYKNKKSVEIDFNDNKDFIIRGIDFNGQFNNGRYINKEQIPKGTYVQIRYKKDQSIIVVKV